ncbi:MAG: CBS domain-containing protein [Anaerolineales bacterium]
MAFLSEILGRTVTDLDGVVLGKIDDVIARERTGFPHPAVDAIVIEYRGQTRLVPSGSVLSLFTPSIPLRSRADELPAYELGSEDIYLSRDVLDKQIIDTDGARVVRVNDLELVRVNGTLYVTNVDVGLRGILRRSGIEPVARAMSAALRLQLPENSISWDNIELLRHDQFMRLRVPAESIAELHPADVAEIISDLNRLETGQLLEAMNVEQVADTLEHVETEFQVELVESMPDEKLADLLEEMEPDEAADLLAELPEERSRRLVALMEKEDADDVRLLLKYPEDSAGGIMTTSYAYVSPEMSAAQAIQSLRKMADDVESFAYIYVLDATDHLQGVFELTDLLFAEDQTIVSDFMQSRVRTVQPLDDQDDVAQIITKYDLLAVPVTDENNVMLGIVMADDALDKIIPTAWKKRLPRFYR